jgi:hypothetical protein
MTTPTPIAPSTTATPTPPATATPEPSATATPPPPTPGPGEYGPYDIEAVGASAAGRVGSVVRIKVGLINHGPFLAYGHAGVMGGDQGFSVTLPQGTKTVGEPHICENGDNAFPLPANVCRISGLFAGDSLLLVLDLQIVGPLTRPGKVARYFAAGPGFPNQFDRDTNPANNVADIVIRVTESGPVLAETGPPTLRLVAAGGAAVTIGTLLIIVSRRRVRGFRPS